MHRRFYFLVLLCVLALCAPSPGLAQEAAQDGKAPDRHKAAAQEPGKPGQEAKQQQGPPPSRVVTAKARSGQVMPELEYVSTVYFPEVANVASEVSGRVDKITFEEGDQVKEGDELVILDTEVTRTDLDASQFLHKQVLSSLENAEKELSRMQELLGRRTISQQDYDAAFFEAAGLRNKATALEANTRKLQLQLKKSVTHAPFDGVVLERHAERGEWLNAGSLVATVARNDCVDVLVSLPQNVLPFVRKEMPLDVRIGATTYKGKVEAIIPKGDVATRTFPVKVRLPNPGNLAQGMEARVRIPSGDKIEAVLVPRDAVLLARGQNMVWLALGGKAVGIPVNVTAYVGLDAAVQPVVPDAPLAPGMDVVIKGNERLRPGQPVMLVDEKGQPVAPKKDS